MVETTKKSNVIDMSKAFEEIRKDFIKLRHKSQNLLHTDKELEFKIKNLIHQCKNIT